MIKPMKGVKERKPGRKLTEKGKKFMESVGGEK